MLEKRPVEKLKDEELVEMVLENQDYFLHIIERYKTKLTNYIRRISGLDNEDCQDLLQEIFLKTYLNLNDFNRSLRFSSWVYSIAHNYVISHHRKIKARPDGYITKLEDEDFANLASNLDVERDTEESLLREQVLAILEKLNVKSRELLVLRFLEDKSYQEISDIIKKPVGTVASALNKAKRDFRQIYEKKLQKYDGKQRSRTRDFA